MASEILGQVKAFKTGRKTLEGSRDWGLIKNH